VNVLFNIKSNPNDDCIWTKSLYGIHIKGPMEAILGIECFNFFKNKSRICQKLIIQLKNYTTLCPRFNHYKFF